VSEHRFAILIDGENIAPRFLGPILAEINRSGEIHLDEGSTADWTETPHGWMEGAAAELSGQAGPAVPLRAEMPPTAP